MEKLEQDHPGRGSLVITTITVLHGAHHVPDTYRYM